MVGTPGTIQNGGGGGAVRSSASGDFLRYFELRSWSQVHLYLHHVVDHAKQTWKEGRGDQQAYASALVRVLRHLEGSPLYNSVNREDAATLSHLVQTAFQRRSVPNESRGLPRKDILDKPIPFPTLNTPQRFGLFLRVAAHRGEWIRRHRGHRLDLDDRGERRVRHECITPLAREAAFKRGLQEAHLQLRDAPWYEGLKPRDRFQYHYDIDAVMRGRKTTRRLIFENTLPSLLVGCALVFASFTYATKFGNFIRINLRDQEQIYLSLFSLMVFSFSAVAFFFSHSQALRLVKDRAEVIMSSLPPFSKGAS